MEQFNIAYHLSRPPAVQRMREINDEGRRKAEAMILAATYDIDYDCDVIHVGGEYGEMAQRQVYGYQTVPSMEPRKSAIKVSTNAGDYPMYFPPRFFDLRMHFALVSKLVDMGFAVGNADRKMVLKGDPEDNTVDTLAGINDTSPLFAGALVHFGVALRVTGGYKIFDAERLAEVVARGADAVKTATGAIQAPPPVPGTGYVEGSGTQHMGEAIPGYVKTPFGWKKV